MENKNIIDFSPFESVEDFKFSLIHGREIEIYWNDIHYSIFHEKDNLYTFLEADKLETEVGFNSIDELLEFAIQGQPLKDIVTEVEILHRNI